MTAMTEALKRALKTMAGEASTMASVSLHGLANDAKALERMAELMVKPAPDDEGDRVVIGKRRYNVEAETKRYPPLTMVFKAGVVRGLGIMLGRVEHKTRSSQTFCKRILQIIDAELLATEQRTGKRCPSDERPCLWDDEIGTIELKLTDVELVIFSDLFSDAIQARMGSWKVHRGEPPYADDLHKIYPAISDHFRKHGGYDHSPSVDNIFHHDPESEITLAYAYRGETL